MFKTILLIIAAVVAAFLGYVALQPAVGTVTRSATIAAPPDAIFPHINNLKKWEAWSPWAKLDPNAKATYEGPEEGPGATFGWDGNSEVGTGKMTITESKPGESVKLRLDFERPMQSTSNAEFALKPEGSGTNVTWTMSGERPFPARIFCVLFRADKMVGEMFEKGLANLGAVSTGQTP